MNEISFIVISSILVEPNGPPFDVARVILDNLVMLALNTKSYHEVRLAEVKGLVH